MPTTVLGCTRIFVSHVEAMGQGQNHILIDNRAIIVLKDGFWKKCNFGKQTLVTESDLKHFKLNFMPRKVVKTSFRHPWFVAHVGVIVEYSGGLQEDLSSWVSFYTFFIESKKENRNHKRW